MTALILALLFPRSLWVAIWLIAFTTTLQAEPWGKDADLCQPRPVVASTEPKKSSPGIKLSECLIAFHQNVISPADGPRSHFIPSSSQYTLDAIRKYGFFRGYIMGCDRLMRENSDAWVYRKTCNGAGVEMKWDPVP